MLYDLLYRQRVLYDGTDKEMCIYRTQEFPYFKRIREETRKIVAKTLQYRDQMEAFDIVEEVRTFIRQNGVTGSKDLSYNFV